MSARRPYWMWTGWAFAAIWACLLLKAALTAASSRTPFEIGLIQTIASVDRLMVLAGLGLGVGLMVRAKLVAMIALLAAMLGALWATPQLLAIFQEWHGIWQAIDLISPLALVIAGIALLLPQLARTGVLPLLTTVVGLALGVSIEVNQPAADPLSGYAAGCIGTSLFISLAAVLAAAIVTPKAGQRWIAVGARIAGSWLIAIGLLLGGLGLLPPKLPNTPAAPAALPREFNQTVQP